LQIRNFLDLEAIVALEDEEEEYASGEEDNLGKSHTVYTIPSLAVHIYIYL
jgi:hypothetical protein